MTDGHGSIRARGSRFRGWLLSLGAGLLAATAGCRTTNAATAEAPQLHQIAPRDPAAEVLDGFRRGVDQRKAAGASMRGEDVASFIEERGTVGDPAAARAAFDAWSRALETRAPGPSLRMVERTLARLQARLEGTIAARGVTLRPGQLTFAAVATGNSYPSVLLVPAAERRLVLVDDRLFDTVYAVVSAAPGTGLEGIPSGCEPVVDALRSQSLVRPRFSVNLRYAVGAARTGRYDLAPRNAAATIALVRSAQLFLMAHEYAHVLLGHVPAAGIARAVTASNAAQNRAIELVFGWDQQVAADALAFELVQETVRREGTESDHALARFGPEVMLFTMGLLDEARAIFVGEKAPAASGEIVEASLLRPSAQAPVVAAALPLDGTGPGAPLWARRTALRETMRRWDRVAESTPSWDAAAFVERTDACIFATISGGLAGVGENRRSIVRAIEAVRRTRAEARRD